MINIAEITGSDLLFGNEKGREVFKKLSDIISSGVTSDIIGISLKGIKATDASFPRESVISLIKSLNGERGFFLKDFNTDDIIDNWDYAAKAKNQNVIIFKEKDYIVIGPKLSSGSIELLNFIMDKGSVTTSLVSKSFDVSAQNASAKLKKLHSTGLILGAKEVAESGGLEYVYRAIR